MNESPDFADTLRRRFAQAQVQRPLDGQAERAARSVLLTRARQRQRRTIVGVSAVVVLALAGLTTVMSRSGSSDPTLVQAAAEVAAWPARGALTQDTTLIARARQVWRQAAPQDVTTTQEPAVVFAGRTADGSALNATVVVLRDRDTAGNTTIAYVTSPLAGPGETVNDAALSVRARTTVPGDGRAAAAFGFVVTTPRPEDTTPPQPAGFAVAITAPGVRAAHFSTSVVDSEMSDSANAVRDGLVSAVLPPGAGAWNTQLVLDGVRDAERVALSASVTDPTIAAVTVSPAGAGTLRFTGVSAKLGDLVVAHDGVLGVVDSIDDGGGTIDVRLQRLATLPSGHPETAITAVPGALATDAAGTTTFTTSVPGVLREGNRLIVRGFASPATEINLGTVHESSPGVWTVRRMASLPTGNSAAVVIGQ